MNDKVLFDRAYRLGLLTLFYNLVEGIVSIGFGMHDEVMSLFGFGVDSFIEVISALGILRMISRIRANPTASRTPFEVTALRVTALSFFGLCAGLLAGIITAIWTGHRPESGFSAIIVSILSISVMSWLSWKKIQTGKILNSKPIISDGNCTKVCVYMSVVLLASSLIYTLTGFAYADLIGSIGLIYFSFKEGKESWDKAARSSREAARIS